MFIQKSELAPFEPPKWAWAKFTGIAMLLIGAGLAGCWANPTVYSGFVGLLISSLLTTIPIVGIISLVPQTRKFMGEFGQKALWGTVILLFCDSRTDETRHVVHPAIDSIIVPSGLDADVIFRVPYKGLLAKLQRAKCLVRQIYLSTSAPHWEISALKLDASLHDDDGSPALRVALRFVFQGRTILVAPEENVLAGMAKYVASYGIFDAIFDAVRLEKDHKELKATVRQLENQIDKLNEEKRQIEKKWSQIGTEWSMMRLAICSALQKFIDSKRDIKSKVVKEALGGLCEVLPNTHPVRMEVERRYGIEPGTSAAS